MNKIHNMMQKYRGLSIVARATFWFFICNVIQKCLSVMTTPIFTRLMTVEQYGQVSVYNSWMQIVTLICTLRLDYGVFYKGMSKYSDGKDEYTVSMQSFSSVITIVLLFVYLIFNNVINKFTELPTTIMVVMFFEVIAIASISYWSIRNRYDYNYKKIVVVTLILSISNIVVGLFAVFLSEEKGVARIVSVAIVQIMIGAIIYMINIKKGGKLFNLDHIKFAFLFNLPLIPHYLSTYILEQSDRIMIQKMVGIAEAGTYSVAYSAGIMIKIVSDSINNALIPWEYRKLEERDYGTLNKQLNHFMILFSMIAMMFIAFAPEAINILAGEKYYAAVYCIPPITASCFFTFIWGVYGNAEFYYDANKFTMYISVAGALLNLILNYIFIRLFGYIAASYTTLICYMLFTIAHFIFINRLTKKKCGVAVFEYKCLISISIIMCICVVILSLLYNHMIIRYTIIAIIGICLILNKNKVVKVFQFK